MEFLGFRSDIQELMAQSSVFCLSSRVEGLPMVLIEAMSQGCCCVAFDCITGPNEIIKMDCGVLVKNQDIDDLANQLARVMSSMELRSEYGLNAPNAVQQFSNNRVNKRWDFPQYRSRLPKVLFRLLISKVRPA